MKTFIMIRTNDETGVSGTGKVLEGAQFSNGQVVVRWISDNSATNIYKNFDSFVNIHILSHPTNGTKIIWCDGNIMEY